LITVGPNAAQASVINFSFNIHSSTSGMTYAALAIDWLTTTLLLHPTIGSEAGNSELPFTVEYTSEKFYNGLIVVNHAPTAISEHYHAS
jgi:hypothetical protein